jgi:hypothetical protein
MKRITVVLTVLGALVVPGMAQAHERLNYWEARKVLREYILKDSEGSEATWSTYTVDKVHWDMRISADTVHLSYRERGAHTGNADPSSVTYIVCRGIARVREGVYEYHVRIIRSDCRDTGIRVFPG